MKKNGFSIFISLLSLARPLLLFMLIAILIGTAGHLFATFIPFFGLKGFFCVLENKSSELLKRTFAFLAALSVFRGVFHYIEQSCNHFIAFKLLATIRDKVFRALRRLCPAKLEGRDRGSLISLITSDIELLEVFYAHTISPIAIAILFSIFMCAFLLFYHWILCVVAFFSYIAMGVFLPFAVSKMNGNLGNENREKSAELSSIVLENLYGLKEISQFKIEKKRLSKMTEKSDLLLETDKKMKKIAGTGAAFQILAILLFDAVFLLLDALLVKNKAITVQNFSLAFIAFTSSFGPASALANLGATLQNTIASASRVLDILKEKPVTEEIFGKEKTEYSGAKIRDLNFSYENDKDENRILSNINMEFEENKIIGISGKSGSGKSTLLKLLMRFWKLKNGSEIEISGKSIEKINTIDLRSFEGYVTQETCLFHDSIKNNLKIANQDATDQEIIEACKKASVHDFIMSLPCGYETKIEELGSSLSSGEKQRLSLARSFLHDSKLLLLDEPTSNLDSLNEAIILKSVKNEAKGKTVVIVSHKDSTLSIAEKNYKIENGRTS